MTRVLQLVAVTLLGRRMANSQPCLNRPILAMDACQHHTNLPLLRCNTTIDYPTYLHRPGQKPHANFLINQQRRPGCHSYLRKATIQTYLVLLRSHGRRPHRHPPLPPDHETELSAFRQRSPVLLFPPHQRLTERLPLPRGVWRERLQRQPELQNVEMPCRQEFLPPPLQPLDNLSGISGAGRVLLWKGRFLLSVTAPVKRREGLLRLPRNRTAMSLSLLSKRKAASGRNRLVTQQPVPTLIGWTLMRLTPRSRGLQ